MPAAPAGSPAGPNQGWYRAALQQAAAGGSVLMGKLVASARLVLQSQQAAAQDVPARAALERAGNLLRQHEPQLCAAYPVALSAAFSNPQPGKQADAALAVDLHFDQLEWMDEAQLQASVSLARAQQGALWVAEASLAELNSLLCSLLGVPGMRVDANPLRPQIYVNALKAVVAQTQAPVSTQAQWFDAMAAALGQELRALYDALCSQLRQQGVAPVVQVAPLGSGADAGAIGGAQDALLTLDKLRRLLSGELGGVPSGNRVAQFAAQFAQQFDAAGLPPEAGNADFAGTVPAALEALTEMRQVEQVVHKLEQRRNAVASPIDPHADSIEGQRLALRGTVGTLAQALSLEVVTLMVDNLVQDARLLEPVRQVIRNLEPALLRLALVDQRFFIDKQHPARRLLQEITHRSMAFDSLTASGLDAFVQQLQQVLAPLDRAPIDSAEIFERQLNRLQQGWHMAARAIDQQRDATARLLQHAEARNLLAEEIAKGIETHPDSAQVAQVVVDFLCGPWAQVVAQARLKQGAGSAAAEKSEALIPALLWSAHLQLARANPAKLTRLVPRLLATLREGLETIHYPATRTSLFLEALMAIHQQVFRAAPGVAGEPAVDQARAMQAPRPRWMDDGDPWIAPQEAQASNLVDIRAETSAGPTASGPTHAKRSSSAPRSHAPIATDLLPVAEAPALADSDLPLGAWVELWSSGAWVRAQLTWASPHGTLYLFTGVYGATQSMSRRSRDKLWAGGKLRLISGQPMVQEALDAVAQAAMRNSLGNSLGTGSGSGAQSSPASGA